MREIDWIIGRMRTIQALIVVVLFSSCSQSAIRVDPGLISIDICFSPENQCDERLARFIASAKKSLDVAIYDINRDILVDGLIQKSKIIPVRVVIDYKQSRGPHSRAGDLAAAGIPVKFGYQKGIMHNKFIVVDGIAVETGSFNYTNSASERNNENQLYIYDLKTVETFKNRFEELWSRGKDYYAKTVDN